MSHSGTSTEIVSARDGRALAVRVAGPRNALPIVLLHGQIHTATCWSGIMSGPLATAYRLIAPDLAGHGGSDASLPGDTDWMLTDLVDVLGALGASRPVLVGWSFGSVVAAACAASGYDSRGLVLVGAGTRGFGVPGLGLERVRALLDAPVVDGASRPLALDLFRAMLSADPAVADAGVARMIDACRHRPLDPGIRSVLVENARRITLEVRAALLMMPYDNSGFYAAHDGPILQIHGERDGIRPVAAAHERAPWLRRGETEIWPESGHAPFDDEPGRFAARVAAFCREIAT